MSENKRNARVVAFKPRRSFARSTSGSTVREYLQETTAEERRALADALGAGVLFHAQCGRSVYLEGLGVLQPQRAARNAVYHLDGACVLREERELTLLFEKCLELSSFQRTRFAPLLELKELAQHIHPRLPLELSLRWRPSDTRRLLLGLIRHLIYETVVNGRSEQLSTLGCFYSLHNRQGASIRDWCAGADIFLRSAVHLRIEAGEARRFQAPVYQDAWEPLRAGFGDPIAVFPLALNDQLRVLGYELAAATEIPVAVFETSRPGGAKVLTYCTEGLRKIGLERGAVHGVELVMQAAADDLDPAVPLWPQRALALGWILLQSSQNGAVDAGVGMGCGTPLCDRPPCRLALVFTTRYAPLKQPVRAANGAFSYVNLAGITEAEASVARHHSAAHLTALLEHRGLDQITKAGRPCLVSRTGLLAPDGQRIAEAS